ncbi:MULTISPECIES: restriction endonuclease subunit S [unclassified Dysgonomonas]|uniref:restriction endonuclease subunit S n=1 Tax=unclassified Dysgonomonas TaxID=2630389 RepID=UPI0025C189CE|nr:MULTISPECIES: restriction endonuclease subunit S [unclassified Dysgonomonas]
MKKYDSYKDSGIEWIGDVPSCWKTKKIKHLCYVKARVGWKGLKSDEFLTEGFSYLVTGSDFNNGSVEWDACYHISKERYEEDPYIQLQDEDLLITKDGTIGKLAIVSGLDKPACLNSGIFVVRSTNKDFSTKFLFWILKSNSFTQFNALTSYGSTIQHLYQNVFVEFAFPFPTITEQSAIATFLDRKAAEVDELIANKKRLLLLYEEEKTAIINQTVTKGINPDVKMKDSGIDWLGEIPEHWELKRLKNIARVQTGRTPKIQSSMVDFFENGQINWFTPADFERNNELVESKRKLIPEAISTNEVELFPEYSIYLVSIGATLGKVSFFREKASANQQINIISFFQGKYNPLFGYYYLVGNKKMVTLEADYTTLPILNQSKTKNLIFITPPIGEQQSIVCHIKTECDKIDRKMIKTERLIQLLTEYRTTLISEVVTGKIKVTD